MTKSDKQARAPALCFRSQDDALNYARHIVEQSNRSLALNDLDALNRYTEGKSVLVLQVDCYPFGDPFKRDLIFFAIPNRGIGPVAGGVAVEPSMNTPSQEMLSDTSGSQPEVLAGITKLVDSPKGGIPSLVRLESPKERLDYRGQILTGAFNGIVDVMNVGREGEFDVLEARVITQDSRSISSLVESRTKIIDGIEQDESKFFGWAGSEPDLVNFVDSIWVFLDHMGPRLGIDVGQDSKVKILNVVMCSPEHETWISKRVTHDKET